MVCDTQHELLMLAIKKGNIDVCKFCLNSHIYGIDNMISAISFHFKNASRHIGTLIYGFLITREIDINSNILGRTPLIMAVIKDRFQIMDMLLQGPIDLNTKSMSLFTYI